MARFPELNPISPVIPTSYGLSYSTNSLPRNACTTGACSADASAMSWSCAPAQPAPARIVTGLASLSTSATAASDRSSGRTTDGAMRTGTGLYPSGAGSRNTSAGTTTTDLDPRDVRGDRQHRHPAAVGVEQAVDQVQVAGPAAARADRELAGQRRLAARRERGRLLVPDVLPDDAAVAAHRIGEPVQRVTRDPVHLAHAGSLQDRHHHFSHRGCHSLFPSLCDCVVAAGCVALFVRHCLSGPERRRLDHNRSYP